MHASGLTVEFYRLRVVEIVLGLAKIDAIFKILFFSSGPIALQRNNRESVVYKHASFLFVYIFSPYFVQYKSTVFSVTDVQKFKWKKPK